MSSLKVTVDRVTFENAEKGFAILQCTPDDARGDRVTLLGGLAGVGAGSDLRVEGDWTEHPKFGRQFKVQRYQVIEPTDADSIQRYLASGAVKGLGPARAAQLIDAFGDDAIRVLDHEPGRLLELRGVGAATAKKIVASWSEHRGLRDVLMFLQGHGIGPGIAARIQKRFGSSTLEIVKSDPYGVAREVRGVGFLTADRMALSMGIPHDDPARIGAGLAHVLDASKDEGHLYLPVSELMTRGTKLLGVEEGAVASVLVSGIGRGELVDEGGRIYRPEAHAQEVEVARRLRDLGAARTRDSAHFREAEPDIAAVAAEQGIDFTPRQRQALAEALERKLMVITGGPGTGKTTLTVGLIRLFALRGFDVRLAAPTGRAARRLAEASGRPALTIHRLLGFDPATGGFLRDEKDPLPTDVVIVDESSMIDVPLMCSLLRAIPPEARLILIGDVDQLPSVGPGSMLRDLIRSGIAAVAVLDEIFRQAQESQIITGAHDINRGQVPDLSAGGDLFFLEVEDADEILEKVTGLVSVRLPRAYGFHPRDDIQVITPMYRGSAGADQINAAVRDAINPDSAGIERGKKMFREGDKVMQLRNDYQKGVFNGDIGIVQSVSARGPSLQVRFSDATVDYEGGELDQLTPAYAISVHKSQGSEFPAVVIPVTTQHYVMLQRNLLYTALTRARKLAIFVGSRQAIRLSVQRDQIRRRHSALAPRLRGDALFSIEEWGDADPDQGETWPPV